MHAFPASGCSETIKEGKVGHLLERLDLGDQHGERHGAACLLKGGDEARHVVDRILLRAYASPSAHWMGEVRTVDGTSLARACAANGFWYAPPTTSRVVEVSRRWRVEPPRSWRL